MRFLRPRGLPPLPANYSVLSLNEQIEQEARRRVQSELRGRFRSEKEPLGSRPSGNLADQIVAAYKRALGEDDEDEDEKRRDRDVRPKDDQDDPHDDRPEQATASKILAAARKAGLL
jgi:hypothetical protein